jgi:ubiquinone/menaquinone biosynthesis C-methylase UbiE
MNAIKYISKQFGNPSGIGGKISTFLMNCINRKQYKATIKQLSVQESDVILDIGFGNGFFIKQLLKENPKKIVGIEISEDMIFAATRLNQNAVNDDKVEFLKADIQSLPFADNSFDKIYTINTVYFWQDTEKAFAGIKRILKPNGLFVNTFYTKKHLEKLIITKYNFNKYDVAELEKLTVENGFELVEIVEIKKNKSYSICVKK